MILVTLALLGNLTVVKFQDKLEPIDICPIYRQHKENFYKHREDVLNDRVSYLSWDDFVAIQNGPIVPHLEVMCNKKE